MNPYIYLRESVPQSVRCLSLLVEGYGETQNCIRWDDEGRMIECAGSEIETDEYLDKHGIKGGWNRFINTFRKKGAMNEEYEWTPFYIDDSTLWLPYGLTRDTLDWVYYICTERYQIKRKYAYLNLLHKKMQREKKKLAQAIEIPDDPEDLEDSEEDLQINRSERSKKKRRRVVESDDESDADEPESKRQRLDRDSERDSERDSDSELPPVVWPKKK